MNASRLMSMAVTTCATGLCLAACTAGITTANPGTSRSPATSRTPSSPTAATSHTPSASASSASSADTVSVDAPIGTFPVPPGAQVLANATCDRQIIIELTSVTPSQASAFYLSALPRDGYKITSNSLVDTSGSGLAGAAAEIEFAGHGYKGTIAAVANLGALASTGPSPVSVPSDIAKNFFTITLTPPGKAGC